MIDRDPPHSQTHSQPPALLAEVRTAHDGPQQARWILVVVIAMGLLWRLPTLFDPPWVNDEGTYAAIGHLVRAGPPGSLLYSTIWDNKPPAIYLLYAAADAVGGSAYLLILVRLAALVAVLAMQGMLYSLGRVIAGPVSGLTAAAIAGVALHLPMIEGTTANAEIFLAALTLAAMVLILDDTSLPFLDVTWRFLIAGLCLGLAIQFKVVATADALAALLLVTARHGRSMLVWVIVGIMIPSASVLAVFAAHGLPALDACVYATLGYNLSYAGAGNSQGQAIVPFALLGKAAIPLVATIGWIRTRRYSDPFWRRGGELALWVAWASAGALSSGRFYPHYAIQVVAPLSCLISMLLIRAIPRWMARQTVALLGVICLTLVGISLFLGSRGPDLIVRRATPEPLAYYALVWWRWTARISEAQFLGALDPHAAQVQEIAALVRSVSSSRIHDSTLFVWGNRPWLYTLTGMTDPTPFTSTYYRPLIRGEMTSIERSLRAELPAVLVTFRPFSPPIPAAIQAVWSHYRMIGQIDNAIVYARR